jgi:cation diffusion facilitator family transporter
MRNGHRFAAGISLAGALLVLAGKATAFILTGSVSLLSDAAESIVNVLAAAALLFAVQLAQRPADYEHPYGHQKAELLSSAFEAALILLAGGMILFAALQRLFNPQPIMNLSAGVVIAMAAALLNLLLALWLRSQGRRLGSAALATNSRHLFTDVWSTVGVVAAIVLVSATGWIILDPLIAIAVAVNIAREGFQVMTSTLSQLMDERLPESEEAAILSELDATPGVLGYHRLKSRRSGSDRFAEVDVFVDPAMNVEHAHALVGRLEENLRARLPGLVTTVHVEPFAPGVREGATSPREEFGNPEEDRP